MLGRLTEVIRPTLPLRFGRVDGELALDAPCRTPGDFARFPAGVLARCDTNEVDVGAEMSTGVIVADSEDHVAPAAMRGRTPPRGVCCCCSC